jgi:hypothetical protein
MNINKKLIAAVAAGIIGVGGFAPIANAASSLSAGASARIAGALDISESTPLNFGAIDNTAGTVVIGEGTSPTYTFNTTAQNDASITQGVFAVTGDASASYALTIDSSTSIGNGTDTLGIALTATQAGGGALDGTGNDTVYVGGTLTVLGGESSGLYTGNYNISVAYN